MAVTGVGADMVRNARYFGLATRIAAEIGSQFIKSYFVEDGFEKIVLGCPVPIVIAGGKKLPERDALDMGRNVFQSANPVGMLKALEAVVHFNATGAEAFELFQDCSVEVAA